MPGEFAALIKVTRSGDTNKRAPKTHNAPEGRRVNGCQQRKLQAR